MIIDGLQAKSTPSPPPSQYKMFWFSHMIFRLLTHLRSIDGEQCWHGAKKIFLIIEIIKWGFWPSFNPIILLMTVVSYTEYCVTTDHALCYVRVVGPGDRTPFLVYQLDLVTPGQWSSGYCILEKLIVVPSCRIWCDPIHAVAPSLPKVLPAYHVQLKPYSS